jgi:hypothetical protein
LAPSFSPALLSSVSLSLPSLSSSPRPVVSYGPGPVILYHDEVWTELLMLDQVWDTDVSGGDVP